MSEAAPAFTPSPGIPNQAHALFYAALAKETGGAQVAPKSTPQSFHTPATLQKFAEVEKANAPRATPTSTTPSVATIKEYQANRGKPAPAVVLDGGPDQIARIDAEMRAAGQQTGADTVAAKDKLIAEYRATPEAQRRNPAWRRDWEAKYAAADAGGETKPAEAKPAPVPTATNAPTREVNTAVDFIMKNANADGMMVTHAMPKALLSGYTLPSGTKVHAETAIRMLADARRDGVPQSVVDAYVRALK